MANCSFCKHQVAPNAEKCPQCGAVFGELFGPKALLDVDEQEDDKHLTTGIGAVLAFVMVVMLAIHIFS